MSRHTVAEKDAISDGERLIVQLEGKEIAVFRHDGQYFAHANFCPHQSGPGCEGPIDGTTEATFDRETLETTTTWTKDQQIITCPWHGWEFDITSGDCLSKRDVKLISYAVDVEDGEIVVDI